MTIYPNEHNNVTVFLKKGTIMAQTQPSIYQNIIYKDLFPSVYVARHVLKPILITYQFFTTRKTFSNSASEFSSLIYTNHHYNSEKRQSLIHR